MQKIIIKIIKKGLRDQARDKLRNLSEEKNIKKERIWEETDIIMGLKKRKKN